MVSFFLGAGSFSTAFVPQQRFISPNIRASVRMGLSVGDKFPDKALKSWGVSSKPCVVYFYGGDGSPSCTKEANAFDEALSDFKALGVTVVGVRNEGGVKEGFAEEYGQKFVIDVNDEVRNEIGVAKDLFGLLGGRETYLLDSKGVVQFVFNDQFGAEKHASNALSAAIEAFPKKKGPAFEFPKIELPFMK